MQGTGDSNRANRNGGAGSHRTELDHGWRYEARFSSLAASGAYLHGEADLVESFKPSLVLDAGCGTGRVAIELDRRGIPVVGVDVDLGMLEVARSKAPQLVFIEHDLSAPTLRDAINERCGPQLFDVIVAAGNVMIFTEEGTEPEVLSNMASLLAPHGHFIAGFQVSQDIKPKRRDLRSVRPGPAQPGLAAGPHRLSLEDYDYMAEAAGLVLKSRFATWERDPYHSGDYAVSVHCLA
ncbi:MAG: class I SAM-dependent methyltransferase [Actinobacteria bacterium]|nr:class I SAM-dependent methyltransferase [Actinomycetota bacterium]